MTNDIPQLYQTFQQTVDDLRKRRLPASDLGARVRLSKTPEAYQAARGGHPEPQYEALLAAGRTRWHPGERVRFYRTGLGAYTWLPEEADEAPAGETWDDADGHEELSTHHSQRSEIGERRDYDVEHYLHVLVTSYAARLRRAFAPEDFAQLFRLDGQQGLFDQPITAIQPRMIRCL